MAKELVLIDRDDLQSIMDNDRSFKEQIDALLSFANDTTKAGDVELGEAIRTLCDGFGQGGGLDKVFDESITYNLSANTDFDTKILTLADTTQVDIKSPQYGVLSAPVDLDNYDYVYVIDLTIVPVYNAEPTDPYFIASKFLCTTPIARFYPSYFVPDGGDAISSLASQGMAQFNTVYSKKADGSFAIQNSTLYGIYQGAVGTPTVTNNNLLMMHPGFRMRAGANNANRICTVNSLKQINSALTNIVTRYKLYRMPKGSSFITESLHY